MKKATILFLLIPICVANIFGQIYDIEYSSGTNYEIAKFRFWTPKSKDEFKALLVIVPGYNGDGRYEASDSIWQAFASKNDLAIVACYFKDYNNPDIFYREASKGSGIALLNAIQKAGAETSHPEIVNAPLIMFGQSAGGQFNYEFACWKPEKVLSFVVNKGGFYHTAIAPVETRKTPAIFFSGENDLYYRNDLIRGIFSVNRKLGAYWTLISEKNTKHKFEASRTLAIKYFDCIIPLRLSPSKELLDLSEIDYYLGNWETKKTIPCKGEANPDSLTVWLPDSTFAIIWERQFYPAAKRIE